MPKKSVYFEEGAKSVFAVALKWPGWARRSSSRDRALDLLMSCQTRYERVIGRSLPKGPVTLIGSVQGDATTDFGAPGAIPSWDAAAITVNERRRQLEILERCWHYFDEVVEFAPPTLAKGPRGGGRDRDDVAEHVREAERAYGRKIGLRIPPRTLWHEQRTMLIDRLKDVHVAGAWPTSYAIRRLAWHVVDHAWEIEDKSAAR
ncbi:MAG: hypothetical protein WAN30_08315 [Acidimicrobiales bacterium]